MSELEQYLSDRGAAGIFTRLARLGLLVETFQRRCLTGFDISFIEFSALRVLTLASPSQALTATDLGRYLLRSSGGVTQIVDRLAQKGLVERRENPSDRRQILIELTREGRSLGDRAQVRYVGERERVTADLTEHEIELIDHVLHRLLAILGDDEEAAKVR